VALRRLPRRAALQHHRGSAQAYRCEPSNTVAMARRIAGGVRTMHVHAFFALVCRLDPSWATVTIHPAHPPPPPRAPPRPNQCTPN